MNIEIGERATLLVDVNETHQDIEFHYPKGTLVSFVSKWDGDALIVEVEDTGERFTVFPHEIETESAYYERIWKEYQAQGAG